MCWRKGSPIRHTIEAFFDIRKPKYSTNGWWLATTARAVAKIYLAAGVILLCAWFYTFFGKGERGWFSPCLMNSCFPKRQILGLVVRLEEGTAAQAERKEEAARHMALLEETVRLGSEREAAASVMVAVVACMPGLGAAAEAGAHLKSLEALSS